MYYTTYTIKTSEVSGEYVQNQTRDGAPIMASGIFAVRAVIQPPVELNPEAVSRFVTTGNDSLGSLILIGSTQEETIIYGELKDPEHLQGTEAATLAESTRALLADKMGLDVIIGNGGLR